MFDILKRTGKKGRYSIIAACLIICMISGLVAGCSSGMQNNPSASAVSGTEDDTHKDAENGRSTDIACNGGNKDEGSITVEEKSGKPVPTEEPEQHYDSLCPYPITTMPVVVINTGGEPISETKDYTEGRISFYTSDGSFVAEEQVAGLRIRGNATRWMEKKSYRVKLDEKLNLFGLANGKEKVWVLYANHCDQTLLRNYTAYMLQKGFNALPWYPNGMSVELYLNDEYQGVYFLAEQIKASKNRVKINDEDPDAVDTGYLVQFTANANENVFWIGDAAYEVKSDLSEDPGIREEQINFIADYITRCREALEAGDEEEASKLIDIDSLVAAYLTEEISRNMDAQWDNFFMQKDKGGKLVIGPLADFDLAFGNDWRAEDSEYDSYLYLFVGYGWGSRNGSVDTIFQLAMNNDWFRKRVKDTWNAGYERFAGLADLVEEEAKARYDAYNRNFTQWQIFGQCINQEPYEIMQLKNYDEHVEYLAAWIRNRVKWLNLQFNRPDFIFGN